MNNSNFFKLQKNGVLINKEVLVQNTICVDF